MTPEREALAAAVYFETLLNSGVPIVAATQLTAVYIMRDQKVDVVHHEPDLREPWQRDDDEG